MRAVVIAGYGGVEKLEVREVARPAALGDRVLVRVRAAALNRADVLQRRGRYPAPPGAVQDIPGLEFAGEVAGVGGEVRAWRVGQRVFGITAGGAQAEYVVVPEPAAWTSTRSPGRKAPRVNSASCAVMKASGTAAASAQSRLSGTATYSACAPPAVTAKTRCPTRHARA